MLGFAESAVPEQSQPFQLPASSFELRASSFELRASSFELPN